MATNSGRMVSQGSSLHSSPGLERVVGSGWRGQSGHLLQHAVDSRGVPPVPIEADLQAWVAPVFLQHVPGAVEKSQEVSWQGTCAHGSGDKPAVQAPTP